MLTPANGLRHQHVETAYGAVHYVEAGAGDPLLLIHGAHGGWVHWIKNIEGLALHRTVIALDLPGFGQSFTPESRPSLENYGDMIAAFVEALALENVAVVGFSFGTLVAAQVALVMRGAVTSLTLVNPSAMGDRSPGVLAILENVSQLARNHGLRAGVEATIRQVMLVKSELVDEALITLLSDCVKSTRYPTRQVSRAANILRLLQKAPDKTMVVIGTKDPHQSHDLAGRRNLINGVLGKESVHFVDDAAHWLQYEQPEIFNRLLVDFLDCDAGIPTA